MKQIYFLLTFSLLFIGCQTVQNLASSVKTNTATYDKEPEPAPTPNAQTSAQCRNILGGNSRNKINDRGELPADMPLPDGSVLCGYVDGQRATYYINETIGRDALAQYYRDTLPPQGFDLQTDNPENGGRFMVFGRGTSETLQIETVLSAGAEFRNMFSIAYMPPNDERGNALTGTMIMRRGSSDRNSAPAQTANSQNASSQIRETCGDNPVGSVKCAIALQEKLKNWKFIIVYAETSGRRSTYDGERASADGKVVIRTTISGAGRAADGEWWFRLGASPLDNGQRIYVKENGAWKRMQSPPDNFGEVLPNSNAIGLIDSDLANAASGTERINGEECNRFSKSSDDQTVTVWISKTSGYAVRKISKDRAGNTVQTDAARQGEISRIETPPGAE